MRLQQGLLRNSLVASVRVVWIWNSLEFLGFS
jgi:hypothetical protein